ncbi:dGTP triphosphohydrolase [Clostridium thailandense]|uniref:dGTP triphosphohydrolase n=1 Tax=Clostridium thailandense TaxID=2794346 RepID=UPI003989BF06
MVLKSKFASNSGRAQRLTEIEEHPIRTKFQRDRDRILYSRAFRRLSGKTQVFLATDDDHIRNRLTHTLEVSQIARTIARALLLDEDLTEAIALGHDIGHTPFGHVGERTLNHIMNGCHKIKNFNTDLKEEFKGFKHNWQSIRVVTKLEDESLNLTDHTLWGMLNHSGKTNKECPARHESNNSCNLRHIDETCNSKGTTSLEFYNEDLKEINKKINFLDCWSFEGLIVGIADEIAQRHHDIEDALEYELISRTELVTEIKNLYSGVLTRENYNKLDELMNSSMMKPKYMKDFSRFIVNLLTSNVINTSQIRLNRLEEDFDIKDTEDFYEKKESILKCRKEEGLKKIISFNDEMDISDEKFSKFLKQRILNSFKAQRMDGTGKYSIIKLFEAYVENPQQLPDKTILYLYKNFLTSEDLKEYMCDGSIFVGKLRNKLEEDHYAGEEKFNAILLRTICDYISGMTDRYAISEHKKLYNC